MKGEIKKIFDEETFGSGFTKREFVLNTGGEYPQDIKFEVVKDKCAMLDKFAEGQSVEVSFNVKGNEYNGKYYVNLQCWKMTAEAGSNAASNEPQY